MKDIEVFDQETGVTLTYKWRDSYGWCVSFSDEAYKNEDIHLFRKIMKVSREHWPETPVEYKDQVEKNNKELLDVCRSHQ